MFKLIPADELRKEHVPNNNWPEYSRPCRVE